jgi:hypothetical protein
MSQPSTIPEKLTPLVKIGVLESTQLFQLLQPADAACCNHGSGPVAKVLNEDG